MQVMTHNEQNYPFVTHTQFTDHKGETSTTFQILSQFV